MSSNRWAEAVAEFHRARGNAIPTRININLPPEVLLLRLRLMTSELGELAEAMQERDLVEVADGLADLIYVTVGTAVEYGLGPILHLLFEEVHRSNMTKNHAGIKDGMKYGTDGGKGSTFEPPRLKEILQKELDLE